MDECFGDCPHFDQPTRKPSSLVLCSLPHAAALFKREEQGVPDPERSFA